MALSDKREELVSEVTSYYEFLVDLYLPPDALKRPPPEGWPDIDQEHLGYLKKDDEVLDIIRHLPYIRQDIDLEPYQIYERCVCNDFSGRDFWSSSVPYQDVLITEPIGEELDSCVLTLARSESRDGYFIFYNTKNHTLELVDYQDAEHRERGVKAFFEMLKKDFRELFVYPTEPTAVHMAKRAWSKADNAELQDRFRQFGWATERYRKLDCMAAVKALDDAQFEARSQQRSEQRRLMAARAHN